MEKGPGFESRLVQKKKKKKKTSSVEGLPDGGWSGMGNSYRHGLGHKCSRWRPRVHPVNTYLFMLTWVDMACLSTD